MRIFSMKKSRLLVSVFVFALLCSLVCVPEVSAGEWHDELHVEDMTDVETVALNTDGSVAWPKDNPITKPYKVELPANGIVTFTVEKIFFETNNEYHAIRLYVYNEDRVRIMNNETDIRNEKDAVFRIGLAAGTYYFRLRNDILYNGGDTSKMRVDFEATDCAEREPNGTKETATVMETDTLYTGYMGNPSMSEFTYDYQDVYKVSLKKGMVYSLVNTVPKDGGIFVLNPKKNDVTDFVTNVKDISVFTPDYTGDYYICLYNYTGVQYTYTLMMKTLGALPKATKLTSVKGAKKSLTVKWAGKSCDGYEIQYSTSSSMKSAKKEIVKKYKTTSLTIKKLKAKKNYYVRVRTYKTYNKKKFYSAWTKAKKVKTK